MYCKNCGTVNPDGAEFCTVCGASLAPKSKERHKTGLSKNKLIAIIAAAVAVIALIVVIAVAAKSAKPAYEKAALQYVDDLLSLDAERTIKCYYGPEPFWDYYEDNWDDWDIEDMIEECADGIDDTTEDFFDEYGIDLKKLYKAVKVKVTDTKEVKKKKIRNMNEFLEEEMDMDDDTISEAWLVELEVSLTWKARNLDKKFDRKETCEVLVVKIDGKWYAVDSVARSCYLNNYVNREKQYFNEALRRLVDKLTDKLGKSKAGKFLDKMRKLVDELLDSAKKTEENPTDEKLLERYYKLLEEVANAAEEAEEIEKEMSEEEKAEFEAKLEDVFSKLSEIDDGGF